MNRKNLIDAFGDIDEEMFARAEKESFSEFSAESFDDVQAPVFVEGGKRKRSKRGILYAGAGIAACAALAVSLPILTNNTNLPYGNEDTQYSESAAEQSSQTESTEQSEQTESTYTQPITSAAEQEPPQLQLYTKTKEILNAEDIYTIEKTQINITGFAENEALWPIYSNMFYNGIMLIDGSSFFYTTLGSPTKYDQDYTEEREEAYAKMFLFNMETEEHSLILKERSYEGKYGLMFKPMNFVDGWLYYYRMEYYPAGDLEGYGTELWRINVDTKDKEKITDIYMDFYLTMRPGIKSGKYLYFTDSHYSYEEHKSNVWILRYDTEAGKLDTFKEFVNEGGYPISYKNGIIYFDNSGFYFHSDNGEPDKFLFDFDFYDIQAIGKNALIYKNETKGEQGNTISTTIGTIDESFEVRDLALLPGYVNLIRVNADADLKLISTNSVYFDEKILIYDKEADCFSKLNLLSEDDNAVFFTAQGGELKVLVYTGMTDQCSGMTLYTIKK